MSPTELGSKINEFVVNTEDKRQFWMVGMNAGDPNVSECGGGHDNVTMQEGGIEL